MPFADFQIISTYTRADALADGVLIDITATAALSGFKLPTAISDSLYRGYLEPPAGLSGEGQSLEGRMHDLLTMAMIAARGSKDRNRIEFEVLFLMRPGVTELVKVIAHVGPGDEGEAVLTLMLPGDD